MILQNIPNELRELPQWVVAGTDKQPLNPLNGQSASVTDPTTWGTFAQAVNCGYKHIGFVLSANDPYTIVDLDDPATKKINGVVVANADAAEVATISERHKKILAAFDSYAEISQSGLGVHIIVRGHIPHGVRRNKVEIYSDSRYMICTGNVIKQAPVTDNQTLLDALFFEMSEGSLATTELEQVESNLTDDQLYAMGSTAANADKFNKLWVGDWQQDYESQSEADFALLAMLGFYSVDNEQVRRVFRYSALGQRTKANKDNKYLNYALCKIRAKTPPPVDFSALIQRGNQNAITGTSSQTPFAANPQSIGRSADCVSTSEGQQEKETATDNASRSSAEHSEAAETPFPPGFVGELAEYIYSSAIRPVRQIALCASIGLTAGVVGRSFNISGSGLNQYLILLAKTGTGKEGAATGIDAMITAVRPTVPMIDEFIGPGAFASGQALIRVLDKNPCFVSVLGEFGLTLQQLCHPNANAAQVMLKKVLLDIYTKSGWQKTLHSSVYSDADKNTKRIQAPNVSILGESTPETFYSGLDASSIAEGLIPRFSIFEYSGPRPQTNPNAFFPPPDELVRRFGALAAVSMAAQQNRVCSPVSRDRDANAMLKAFDDYATDQINANQNDVVKQLWNRAHLKALKMAALIAVGQNPHQPTINEACAKWAIRLVCADIEKLIGKFDSGEVGTGDVRLELDVRRAITAYLRMTPTDRRGYQCPDKMATMPLIPLQYLRRRLRLLVNFKTDRRGATAAMTQTLNALVEGEVLLRLAPKQALEQCGTSSPVYGLGPAWHG